MRLSHERSGKLELSTVTFGDDDADASFMREAEVQPGSKSMAHAHGGTRKPGRPRGLHRACGRAPRGTSPGAGIGYAIAANEQTYRR